MTAHGERVGGICPEMSGFDRWGGSGKPLFRGEAPPAARAETGPEESMEPCPFCGARADAHIHAEKIWNGQGRQVKCYECQSRGPAESTLAKSVEAWNKAARAGRRQ